jgi:phosphoribosylamine--glycine ligase
LQKDRIPYKGFIFFGIIKVGDEPKVIEYNCRMGDPETEVVIPRMKSDFLELLMATSNGTLADYKMVLDDRSATTVMLVSGGYPEAYEKNKKISGINSVDDSLIFHAGTKTNDSGEIVTNGGRVIAVTSYGEDYNKALKKSYENISKIDFEGMNYRKDIGFDL